MVISKGTYSNFPAAALMKQINVFFVYRTARSHYLDLFNKKQLPDNELYGFNHLDKRSGFSAQFSDIGFSKIGKLLSFFFLPIGRYFIYQCGHGFQIGQVLLNLPKLNRSDVIVTTTDSVGVPVCFLRRLGIIRKPVLYTIGVFYSSGKLRESLEKNEQTIFSKIYRWILEGADHIIFHSANEKKKLLDYNLYNPAKCTLLPIGSDKKFFGGGIKKQVVERLILAVGKDSARDYGTFFKAADKLPDYNFAAITSKENIKGLDIPNNVKLYLNIPYAKVRDFYKEASLVVIPIKEEKRSSGQMTLTDVMQIGKPLIISDIIGIRHYPLRSGLNVIKVPPGNSSDLIGAIRDLSKNKKLQKKLSGQLLKLGHQFTTENYSHKLIQVIKYVLDPIKLNPIQKSDLEFLRSLRNENNRFFISDGYISEDNQKKWFAAYKNKNDDYMFVLTNNSINIGTGAIYNINDLKKTAEIGRFLIDQKYRGRGYGKILLRKIEDIAFKLEIKSLRLEVFSDNKTAINLYKESGFSTIKEEFQNGRKLLLMEKIS